MQVRHNSINQLSEFRKIIAMSGKVFEYVIF